MKAERSGSLETAQTVTEKAEEIKAKDEKSVSSVAETAPKHETVHEMTVDRIAAVTQDAHEGQMMEVVEASTKTAHETMKEADMTTKTGEYENASGVEKASTPIAAMTHESKQDATADAGMSNTVSASVLLERSADDQPGRVLQKKMRAVQDIMLGREGVERATRWRKKLTDLRKNGDQRWFAPRR